VKNCFQVTCGGGGEMLLKEEEGVDVAPTGGSSVVVEARDKKLFSKTKE